MRYSRNKSSCILSKFYIKPQQRSDRLICFEVVSYRNSTSNHNLGDNISSGLTLYLIEILHQTTTTLKSRFSCKLLYLIEILHQTTTGYPAEPWNLKLYLIEILHQTTTRLRAPQNLLKLYLIEILHQTTTIFIAEMTDMSCILSKFYIKPQQTFSSPCSR